MPETYTVRTSGKSVQTTERKADNWMDAIRHAESAVLAALYDRREASVRIWRAAPGTLNRAIGSITIEFREQEIPRSAEFHYPESERMD